MSHALKAARHYVRPETGFLHYHPSGEAPYATIPLFENFCYVLALFKTKEKEEVEKGIELLLKLLPFQNEEGFFPLYLHEYPIARDHILAFNHLKPLVEIAKFNAVIPYRDKLNKAIDRLKSALKPFLDEKKPASFNAHMLSKVFLGDVIPVEFSRATGSNELAEMLMINEREDMLSFMWYPITKRYIGPAFREKEEGYEPEDTLLNYLLGHKSAKPSLASIQSILINEVKKEPLFVPFKTEKAIEGYRFGIWQEQDFAISCLDKRPDMPQFLQPGCKVLQIITGPHSLVIEGNTGKSTRFEFVDNGVDLYIELKETMDLEDREKQREINIFFDNRVAIRPSQKQSTLFNFNESIELHAQKKMTLTLSVAKGHGDFVCHVMNENRSSQKLVKETFDKAIGIRTLRRDPHLIVKASFRL
ncbi:MAG: hypothetical protein ACK4HV_00235 [Parachlamydiaceae bacterium]